MERFNGNIDNETVSRIGLFSSRQRATLLCRAYGAQFFSYLPTLPASRCSPSAWANLWSRLRRLDCRCIKNCAAERTMMIPAVSPRCALSRIKGGDPRIARGGALWKDFAASFDCAQDKLYGAQFFFSRFPSAEALGSTIPPFGSHPRAGFPHIAFCFQAQRVRDCCAAQALGRCDLFPTYPALTRWAQ
jgi:hypothetical protein